MKREEKSEIVRYFAFLRGINVGGTKVIRMEELQRLFEGAGLKEVKTFIQSGNVRFRAAEKDPERLTRKITEYLKQQLGYEVQLMLRTEEEMEALVGSDPFKGWKEDADTKLYVSFLAALPEHKMKLPLIVEKEGIEVISQKGREACIISRRVAGRYGFPNLLIEKELKVPATTRNWNTVLKMHYK